jgi:hypothetical protein
MKQVPQEKNTPDITKVRDIDINLPIVYKNG